MGRDTPGEGPHLDIARQEIAVVPPLREHHGRHALSRVRGRLHGGRPGPQGRHAACEQQAAPGVGGGGYHRLLGRHRRCPRGPQEVRAAPAQHRTRDGGHRAVALRGHHHRELRPRAAALVGPEGNLAFRGRRGTGAGPPGLPVVAPARQGDIRAVRLDRGLHLRPAPCHAAAGHLEQQEPAGAQAR